MFLEPTQHQNITEYTLHKPLNKGEGRLCTLNNSAISLFYRTNKQ